MQLSTILLHLFNDIVPPLSAKDYIVPRDEFVNLPTHAALPKNIESSLFAESLLQKINNLLRPKPNILSGAFN